MAILVVVGALGVFAVMDLAWLLRNRQAEDEQV
jgi:hypothetical protein